MYTRDSMGEVRETFGDTVHILGHRFEPVLVNTADSLISCSKQIDIKPHFNYYNPNDPLHRITDWYWESENGEISRDSVFRCMAKGNDSFAVRLRTKGAFGCETQGEWTNVARVIGLKEGLEFGEFEDSVCGQLDIPLINHASNADSFYVYDNGNLMKRLGGFDTSILQTPYPGKHEWRVLQMRILLDSNGKEIAKCNQTFPQKAPLNTFNRLGVEASFNYHHDTFSTETVFLPNIWTACDSIIWDFGLGDRLTSDCKKVSHHYYIKADYEVCQYVYADKCVDSFCQVVGIRSSVNSVQLTGGKLNIYPNPSNGTVILETSDKRIESVRLYNLQGRMVFSSIKRRLDISKLNDGVYLIEVLFGQQSARGRIILQKD